MLSDRVTEVRELASTLWFLPPPGRAMIADKLHGLGVRVHADLATLQLEREGPKSLGNHAPQRVVKKASMKEGMEALRAMNPDMAARIDAARTPEEKAEVAKDFNIGSPEEALAEVQKLGVLRPEDLE